MAARATTESTYAQGARDGLGIHAELVGRAMRTFRSVVLAASAAALVLAGTRDGSAESVRLEHGLAALLPAKEGAKRCYSLAEPGGIVGRLNEITDRINE